MTTKVCFIIPSAGEKLSNHSAYLADFIKEVGSYLPVATIIAKEQKFNVFFLCLKMRQQGYKYFYVHYSYIGATAAKLTTTLFGGKVFYWNCGMMWLFGKKYFLRFILWLVDELVTGNETMKQGYHEHFGVPLAKIKVMPNWVDVKRFEVSKDDGLTLRRELNIPAEAPVVLFLHRLAPRKGTRFLPAIVSQVAKEIPATHFIIAGSGPDEAWLKKQLETNKQVRFLGAWPNDRVPELMAAADAYIMPSEEEGFPRVLLEAQAAGLPYAGFDIGGTREISPAEEQNYIKTVGDTAGLTSAVIDLLRLPPAGRTVFKHALQNHVKQYDKNIVAKLLADIITAN